MRHAVFRRLETDAEFHARLIAEGTPIPPHGAHVKGEELDHYAWGHHRKQRRIVEDEAGRPRPVATVAVNTKPTCPKCGTDQIEPFAAPMIPPGSQRCLPHGHVWWKP